MQAGGSVQKSEIDKTQNANEKRTEKNKISKAFLILFHR